MCVCSSVVAGADSSRTRTYPEFNNNAAAVHPPDGPVARWRSHALPRGREKESEKNKNSVVIMGGWAGGLEGLRRNARTNDSRH